MQNYAKYIYEVNYCCFIVQILDTRFWLLVARYSLLAARYSLLVARKPETRNEKPETVYYGKKRNRNTEETDRKT